MLKGINKTVRQKVAIENLEMSELSTLCAYLRITPSLRKVGISNFSIRHSKKKNGTKQIFDSYSMKKLEDFHPGKSKFYPGNKQINTM